MTTALAIAALLLSGCAASETAESKRTPEIERGRYLVVIMGCNDCHTSDTIGGGALPPEQDWLLGGVRGFHGPWGTVYPTNLRLLLDEISEDSWLALAKKMRGDSPMAWSWLPRASDDDLRAIYQFVRALGPGGVPAPAPLPPGVVPTTDYITFPLPH